MSAGSNQRTRRTAAIALALTGACATISAGAAAAQTGTGGGGIGTPDPPIVKDITCAERCLALRTVTETGQVELTGSGLGGVTAVRFNGADGKLKVRPDAADDASVLATVPIGAVGGRVRVRTLSGQKAASPVAVEVKPKGAIKSVDGFAVKSAEATPRKTFFDSSRGSELDYLFAADGPTDVRIDVIDKRTGTTVDSVVEENQRPFANHSFSWDGLDADNGVARSGEYRFEVSQLSGGPGAGASFEHYDHIFPLRGKHYYGDGLGGGRGHQGQDVFAKCGTRIVAARGGRVQVNDFQSSAGYYVVIDGRRTGDDYAYMHLRRRGRPAEGSRVHTGEVIGYESDTGNASGCHLHFELWSAPGWYQGGHVLNPTAALKRWDRYS